ncbi:DNA polymerase III subunit beta [Microcoleus sp. Pol10_D6]|uniref:DNA polymerase III subunit beta n=1 Tax=Microcoleus sp. Pol10_D6 TaxID=2818875 RepID=UPI002FD05F82
MAKSRLSGTPSKEEVVERTAKKKPSTVTGTNLTPTTKPSVKKTTKLSSPLPKTTQIEEVEANYITDNGTSTPSDTPTNPTLETHLNNEITASPTPTSSPSTVKIACDLREFNDYIQTLKSIIPSNTSHPILCNILIEADAENQQLHLTGYNLEFGMQVNFDANVNQPGKLTLPAPILADILGKFPNGRLTLKSSFEIIKGSDIPSVSATLSSSNSKHVIRGLAADEFPSIPSVKQKLVTLPASVLIAVLKASLFAVTSEETKRILMGANFQLSHDADRRLNQLRVWTTDGHRVAMIVGLSESSNSQFLNFQTVNFTVPAKVLRVLERSVNASDKVTIYYDGSAEQPSKFVAFEWNNLRLTAQLLEGNYPKCDQIIAPYRSELSHQIVVERLSFLKALERLATHSDKSHITAIFDFDLEAQQVRASLNNTLSSGTETVDAKLWGCDFRLKCDIRYLIDTIKAVSSSDLRFLMATPTAPLLIVPFGTPASGTEALECEYVVAPQE